MAPAREKPLTWTMTEVARVGDSVLRESGPWTPTIQRLLAHLRDTGIDWCPEPMGWSADGREALSYLKGKVPSYPMPDWVYSTEILVDAAAWLRQLHDATQDYVDPEARWRGPRHRPAEVICHNDFAPYNMVFRDHHLVGVIDWDFAAPGPRLWDLAYLAYRLVPLMRPANPDAPQFKIDLSQRVKLLLETYGTEATVPELLRTVIVRLEDLASFTHSHGVSRKNERLIEDGINYSIDAAYLRSLFA